MFGTRAHKLGWTAKPNESEDERLLRPNLLSFVANTGEDKGLIESAKALATAWLKDRTVVSSDVSGALLASAARSGGAALYEQFLTAAKREKDPRDKRTLIGGLAAFQDPVLVQRNLSYLLDGTFDPREAEALMFAPMRESATSRFPLAFVRSHVDELATKLPGDGPFSFLSVLPFVAEVGCSEDERAQTEAFFGPRVDKITGAPRNLAKVLESIHLCAARTRVQRAGIAEFLRQY